jgi:hypothetical protein
VNWFPLPSAWLLLAGVAATIWLLHLLKPRAQRRVVASALLWRRVLGARPRQPQRWRWWLSLALALGIGLSLALALVRPDALAPGAGRKPLVVVLDNAPSMAAHTRDGRTRWQRAVAEARSLLETRREAMLLDTMGFARAAGFVARDSALAELERLPVASYGIPRLPPAALARDSALHLFTDGVGFAALPSDVVVHSVFEPADNVALTAFEARALLQDPTRYQAFAQVHNASPGSKRVRLLIRGGETFALTQDLEVAAGELVDLTFDVSAFEGGVLGAAVAAPDDAFPLDDLAYAVVAPHAARRVLLITPGNPRLADSLRALPGTQLTVVPPSHYASVGLDDLGAGLDDPGAGSNDGGAGFNDGGAGFNDAGFVRDDHGAGRYDAYVFDRFVPAKTPRAALLFAAASGRVTNPAVGGWDTDHPLTAGIAWSELRVRRTAPAAAADGVDLVWTGPPAPRALIAARANAAARAVRVGFGLDDSNFALQAGFPVFLGKALAWLTQHTPVLIRAPGQVQVPLRDARVVDGAGRPLPVLRSAAGTVFEAPRPDVYTASGSAGSVQVAVNVLDPRYAQINRSILAAGGDAPLPAAGAVRRWLAQSWMLLLSLSAGLLLVEWAAFTRRVTA